MPTNPYAHRLVINTNELINIQLTMGYLFTLNFGLLSFTFKANLSIKMTSLFSLVGPPWPQLSGYELGHPLNHQLQLEFEPI